MLYSRKHNIALPHYHKTAGSSLQRWFFHSFPDAEYLFPLNCHLNVPESLKVLVRRSGKWRRVASKITREAVRIYQPPALKALLPWPLSLRVIGVMRDPFEMIVSLYEFWRRCDYETEPTAEFILCARHGEFRDFLAAAIIGNGVETYENFFGCGGPLWSNTRLLDFNSLEPGLEAVCEEFGIPPPERLPSINVAPKGQRNLDRYRDEAGPLVFAVHRRFRWYYEEGVHLMVRGKQPLRSAA